MVMQAMLADSEIPFHDLDDVLIDVGDRMQLDSEVLSAMSETDVIDHIILPLPEDCLNDEIPFIEGLKLEKEMEQDLRTDLWQLALEFHDVFGNPPTFGLEKESPIPPMVIKTKPDWSPPPVRAYRTYGPAPTAAMRKELQNQLDCGYIEVSGDTRPSFPHMVRKPESDSGYRFTVDYREKNEGILFEPYPLPLVADILRKFSITPSGRPFKYFGRLDLRNGYWQFPLHPDSRWITSFVVDRKVYQYRVVAQGLVCSAAHVQASMERILDSLLLKPVWVYLDDICFAAESSEEFLELTRQILLVLRINGLKCKPSKCMLGVRSITILGHEVSRTGLRMSRSRISAVMDIPMPRNVKDLRSFLGMVNYMRDYIPNVSVLMHPLLSLVNVPLKEWPLDTLTKGFLSTKESCQ